MYTNLRDRIRKIFLMFIIHVYRLARRMNLRPALPALEKLVRKAGWSGSNWVTDNAIAPDGRSVYILGSSATAAGDIAQIDERSGEFPNIYPAALPPDGSWGTWTDHKGEAYSIQPVIGSQNTLEHIWDFYQSTAPDPIAGGKEEDQEGTVGDYMSSSIFDLGDLDHDDSPDHNYDGDTKFFTNGTAGPT